VPKAGQWATQSEADNFIDFANDRPCRDVNCVLSDKALTRLPSPFSHMDVASGTGLVAQEVCTLCQEQDKEGNDHRHRPRWLHCGARASTRPGLNCVAGPEPKLV